MLPGKFVLADWKMSGLNVTSAVKRGIYTVDRKLVIKIIGNLQKYDVLKLDNALKSWLRL